MLTVQNYLIPSTIEEALTLLNSHRRARIVGGGVFMRLGSNLRINTAIDLEKLSLDLIHETDTHFEIGAMVTLRTLETFKPLKTYFNDALSKSVRNIMGVQLRNIATVGGTVMGRFGFSDLLSVLLTLEADLAFEGRENCSLEHYLSEDRKEYPNYILKSIRVPKIHKKVSFQMLRKTSHDYALLNVAVSNDHGQYRITVGARPQSACLALKSMKHINESHQINEALILKTAELVSEEMVFGSNRFGSEAYRKEMCKVLIKRALMEVI